MENTNGLYSMEKSDGLYSMEDVNEDCIAANEEQKSDTFDLDKVSVTPPNDDDVFVSVPVSRSLPVSSNSKENDDAIQLRERRMNLIVNKTTTILSGCGPVESPRTPPSPESEIYSIGTNTSQTSIGAAAIESSSGSKVELWGLVKEIESTLDAVFKNWEEIHLLVSILEEIRLEFRAGNPQGILAQVFDLLCEFEQTLEAARADSNILPAPPCWGIPHETTLRYHLGLDAAAIYFSESIIDRLAVLSTHCAVCKCTVRQVNNICMRVEDFLNACIEIAHDTSQSCQSIGERLDDVIHVTAQKSEDKNTIPFRSSNCAFILWMGGLNITDFTTCLQSWADLPSRLEETIIHIRRRTEAVEEFLNIASQEIVEAFEKPYLTSLIQGMLIGEEPPLMQSLLRIISTLKDINVAKILDVIQNLIESHNLLPLTVVRESFSVCVLDASMCFDVLENGPIVLGCPWDVRIDRHKTCTKKKFAAQSQSGDALHRLHSDFHDGCARQLAVKLNGNTSRNVVDDSDLFMKI